MRKLNLNKDTLRILDAGTLGGVQGGGLAGNAVAADDPRAIRSYLSHCGQFTCVSACFSIQIACDPIK
ncbi:MAG: hypothetical protein IPK64_18910 [bacterium]|nr:hypothetical protein [bacterium]